VARARAPAAAGRRWRRRRRRRGEEQAKLAFLQRRKRQAAGLTPAQEAELGRLAGKRARPADATSPTVEEEEV
jgi:hypothetical protein